MRSVSRSRYEGALSQIARGARNAAAVLEVEGDPEAAGDFISLAAWARSEFDRSVANKPPMKGQVRLFEPEALARS